MYSVEIYPFRDHVNALPVTKIHYQLLLYLKYETEENSFNIL